MLQANFQNPEAFGSQTRPPSQESRGGPDRSQSQMGLACLRIFGQLSLEAPSLAIMPWTRLLASVSRKWKGVLFLFLFFFTCSRPWASPSAHSRPQCHSLENGQKVSSGWELEQHTSFSGWIRTSLRTGLAEWLPGWNCVG